MRNIALIEHLHLEQLVLTAASGSPDTPRSLGARARARVRSCRTRRWQALASCGIPRTSMVVVLARIRVAVVEWQCTSNTTFARCRFLAGSFVGGSRRSNVER